MPQNETDIFQHYQVLRRDDGSLWELGRGAMGVTYKAIDTNLDALVALKIINAESTGDPKARERFLREARAAARLRHPNVATVLHLGQEGQNYFYSMEFIEGVTLEGLIKRAGPQSWRNALPIALQVARALNAASEKHLVHRDIKPANIMLVNALDEPPFVKLIDFGLAKSLLKEDGFGRSLTGQGQIGTPYYMGPEQIDPSIGEVDARSDIYSLGATLWHLITGKPPFTGLTQFQLFAQHIQAPPLWDKLPADLPDSVRAMLARMLAKDGADRQQTPAVLRGEIESCLQSLHEPLPPAVPPVTTVPAPVSSEIPIVVPSLASPVPQAPIFNPMEVISLEPSTPLASKTLTFEPETPSNPPVVEPSPADLSPRKVRKRRHKAYAAFLLITWPIGAFVIVETLLSHSDPWKPTSVISKITGFFYGDSINDDSSPLEPAKPAPVPASLPTPAPTAATGVARTVALQLNLSDGPRAFDRGDYVGALAAYQRALTLDATSPEAKAGLEKIRLFAANITEQGFRMRKQDPAKALELYRLAITLGNKTAQTYLGAMYEFGRGGLKADPVEAVRLYKLSAEQGDSSGQACLGSMYEFGKGGLKADKPQAIELYKKAAAQGNDFALGRLKALGLQ